MDFATWKWDTESCCHVTISLAARSGTTVSHLHDLFQELQIHSQNMAVTLDLDDAFPWTAAHAIYKLNKIAKSINIQGSGWVARVARAVWGAAASLYKRHQH